jgi:hypothetical protein
MPQSTISPSQGLRIWQRECNISLRGVLGRECVAENAFLALICTGRHSEVAFFSSEIRHSCEVCKNLDFKQKSYDTLHPQQMRS